MTVRELIEALKRRDPDLPVMVVREEDHSDWANIERTTEHFDPLSERDADPVAVVLYVA